MYKPIIPVIFLLMFVVLVACTPKGPRVNEVNVSSTVTEQADVYGTHAMAGIIGTLNEGETVFVVERTACTGYGCLVENDELSGWVYCRYLDLDEE